MRCRPAVVTVIVGVLSLMISGCGGGDDKSSTAPAAGGSGERPSETLTVYSGRSEALMKDLFARYEQDTGVKVEVRYGDSTALAGQVLTEGSRTPADVFIAQDAGSLGAVAAAGHFEVLPETIVGKVPAEYSAADRTWIGVSGRARVVVFNPELAPTPPATIDEIVDARWKGRVGYAPTNASWQAFVTALRLLRGEAGAESWLRAFKALDPKAYPGNAQLRDAVNAGEVAVGLVNHYYLYEKIAAEGADKVKARNQFMAPNDPAGLVNVAGAGILAKSDDKAAAVSLVEYLVSEKGQQYFAERTKEYPLVPGVAADPLLPPLAQLAPPKVNLTDLRSLTATQDLLVAVGLLTR